MPVRRVAFIAIAVLTAAASLAAQTGRLGREAALPRHLFDGEESRLSVADLLAFGRDVFIANWTDQDGAGRPLIKGTGGTLTDPKQRLDGTLSMNRVSGPDANSCAGCHNAPHGIAGGRGDFASVVFQGAQRFDFVTFDRTDKVRTRGSLDERGRPATLQSVGNARVPPDLFGAGYLEMLARQITADLQRTRDSILPGQSKPLSSTAISFGVLARAEDGRWLADRVEGLPPQSIRTRGPADKPSLVIRPWQASGTTTSLRELHNTKLNQHFGMQPTERFGVGTDPDGDGIHNEVTRGDVTALTVFVATLPVPLRVVPNDPRAAQAVAEGEQAFTRIGCSRCHIPSLKLARSNWRYSEPGPFNSQANATRGPGSRVVEVDLADAQLPQPRLTPAAADAQFIEVPAFTDFKLHDITDPADRDAAEPLDLNQPPSSSKFLEGNRRFLTKRLWAVGSGPPYFRHGLFTTIEEAILAHAGEAIGEKEMFARLPRSERESILQFLGSLQVLEPRPARPG